MYAQRAAPRNCVTLALGALVFGFTGCAAQRGTVQPQPGAVVGLTPAEADSRAAVVRADPVVYLHRVLARCRALGQYTLTLTRCERRGLFDRLLGPEHIACWFRRQPFSVRLKWLDEDIKYGESTYVAGQAGNKVRFVTRWWSPPLLPPPGINRVDLATPVAFGESKRPLTDFGLERLMERSIDALRNSGDDAVVTYEGLVQLPDSGPTAHHIRLEYSAARYRVPIQELYVDAATDVPAGTILKRPSGDVDASYFYTDIDAAVRLTDADFLLDVERSPKSH